MADIQSATAEIRRGKQKRKKIQDKNIMSASATQGGHKKQTGINKKIIILIQYKWVKMYLSEH